MFGITKFEQIGVERQKDSSSKYEANRNFAHSCEVCCCKGMKISCEKCSIAFVHKEIIACFDDYKTAKFSN